MIRLVQQIDTTGETARSDLEACIAGIVSAYESCLAASPQSDFPCCARCGEFALRPSSFWVRQPAALVKSQSATPLEAAIYDVAQKHREGKTAFVALDGNLHPWVVTDEGTTNPVDDLHREQCGCDTQSREGR